MRDSRLLALLVLLWTGCAAQVPHPAPRLSTHQGAPTPVSGAGLPPATGLPVGSGGASLQHEAEPRAHEVEAARVQALVLAARRDARGAEDGEAAARESERERARAVMLGLASGVEELGTTLSFTWWAEQGALTLLGFREERGGGRVEPSVGREELARVLRLVLSEYASRHTGEVVLTLRREETRWAVDYRASPASSHPAEVKTLPVRGPGTPAPTFLALHDAAKRWLRTVQVPPGGTVQAEMRVHLEDGRLTGWEAASWSPSSSSSARR